MGWLLMIGTIHVSGLTLYLYYTLQMHFFQVNLEKIRSSRL